MTKAEFRELQSELAKQIMSEMRADLDKRFSECDNSHDKMLAILFASERFTVHYCSVLIEKIFPFDE